MSRKGHRPGPPITSTSDLPPLLTTSPSQHNYRPAHHFPRVSTNQNHHKPVKRKKTCITYSDLQHLHLKQIRFGKVRPDYTHSTRNTEEIQNPACFHCNLTQVSIWSRAVFTRCNTRISSTTHVLLKSAGELDRHSRVILPARRQGKVREGGNTWAMHTAFIVTQR